jgi:ParB family chromosome partitioning protein
LIKPNPNQPRKTFDPESLAGLAASIETSGIVQPLLVRPLHDGSYELIAGERRWRAAQQAGLEKVPAVVRDPEEAERLQAALIENMAREDLNPVDEARACAALVEDLGLSKEELSRRVGRSRPAVSNLIRLLDLPDEVLELLESGELSEGHGRALLGAEGNDVRRRLARDAAKGGWSVRETENRAKLASQPRSKGSSRKGIDPEEAAAMRDAADRLESALGHEVKVRAKGEEIAVEIRFEDLDEALALARKLDRGGR